MAYTKQTWANLPSETTPFSAARMDHIEDGIYTADALANSAYTGKTTYLSYSGTNMTDLKNWMINTAPTGDSVVNVTLSGAMTCCVVMKASSSYLSFIQFGYGVDARQYKYLNGTWKDEPLARSSMKTITFNDEWLYIHCVGGANMLLMFPIDNPDNLAVTLSLTSSEMYTGVSGWVSMPVFGTGVQSYGKTFVVLRFQNPTGATTTQGYTYLMRMKGTLTIG